MKLTACARTDVGKRRKNNEDSVLEDCARGLFIVADGMGGHAAGEVASRMAVDTICAMIPSQTQPDSAAALREAFIEATQRIHQSARQNEIQKGMGTTLSVLHLNEQTAQIAHVGDSRIYRLRDGKLEQLSIDHSLVAEQVRQGVISEQEARNSQMRNILLQAVGLEDKVNVYLVSQSLRQDDLYLLCSDGLSDMLEDEEIAEILNIDSSTEELATQLIEAANRAGGRDNIGVVVVKIEEL